MIRIVGGDWKGHGLKVPTGKETRPTTAFMREMVFNVLENAEGHEFTNVLDLFAGTGALGLEALSRGASSAVFVEGFPKALQCLKKNVEELAGGKDCQIIQSSKPYEWAKLLLKRPGATPFDLVFCDPPYRKNLVPRTLKTLFYPMLWAPNVVLVAEMDPKDDAGECESFGWKSFKEKPHGDSKVVFFRRNS